MGDVYAWVEDQRQRKRREFQQLLQRGREIWAPTHIFNSCCVKWLIDGNIQYHDDEYGVFYNGCPFDPPSGCSGEGCNRDHPCITLRFDVDTKSTIAHLSHRLDPFVHYMNSLVAEGKAWPQSASEYQINGYLRPNLTNLRNHDGFGGHLVKFELADVTASDAAQRLELEEKEMNNRAAKCPRKSEQSEQQDSVVISDLSSAAMDIVMKHRLKFDVQDDPLTLFCLTQVSKQFKKFAVSIISAKAKTLDLSVTPLVNGMQKFGDDRVDGYDSETFYSEGFDCVVQYSKKEKISLDFQPSETGDGEYEPTNVDAASFSWDSGKLDRYSDDEHTRDYDDSDYSEYAYWGNKFRVYWKPKDSDLVKSPERSTDFYGGQKPSIGFKIAEFSLHRQPDIGIVTQTTIGGVIITFEVLESNTSETEEVEEEEEISEYETDEEAEDGVRRVVRIVENMGNYIQFTGRIKLIRVKVDFSVIVRLHARQVLRQLSSKYGRIQRERPLTTTESEYLKFVNLASVLNLNGD